MSRLVVVSNRVPDPDRPPQGGLAVAVQAALNERGGIWMDWSGRTSGAKEPGPLTIREEGAITYALSDLSDRILQNTMRASPIVCFGRSATIGLISPTMRVVTWRVISE